jgi:CheY-like chemotaxis protein
MKVLIVDDELLIRRSLSRIFSQRGHEVTEAENGTEAVKVWKKEKPDLVLLDFMMPGLNGLEVLKEVDPKLKKKIVIMSAYVGSNEYKDFAKLGASHFYSKPFDDIFKFVEEMENLGDK